ncbi:MAG TPA: hydrogenase [Anaeromyxobacter sp.]|nr:hydrogenase [Anaeromyxobacter sp.]
MERLADLLLLVVVVLGIQVVATTRIPAAIRAVALQGAALSLLPFALGHHLGAWAMILTFLVTLGVKALLMPFLLVRAVREARVVHETEPLVAPAVSVLLSAVLVGIAFWLGGALALPWPAPSRLVVPIALATLLLGFLVIVVRRKAITQVVGYLMLENGVFVFGQALARQLPFVVELGILLDVLVGVFVMGIAIHHISREFDHVDVDALSTLRD